MSNVLKYRGYHARVEYDAEDNVFFGHIAGIEDGIGFHAETTAALIPAFHEAVDDYIETCRRIGKDPQRPYSGRVMVRMAPEVHAGAATAASLAGLSMAVWIERTILRAVENLGIEPARADPSDAGTPSGRRRGRAA